MKAKYRLNEQITAPKVRIIGSPSMVSGTAEAIELAKKQSADLILINDKQIPPLCIIQDYGKFIYEKKKQQKNKAKKPETKEIRLSPDIQQNDIDTKLRNARKFLEKQKNVLVTLHFRGRQIEHKAKGTEKLTAFADALSDISVSGKIKDTGRRLSLFLKYKKL